MSPGRGDALPCPSLPSFSVLIGAKINLFVMEGVLIPDVLVKDFFSSSSMVSFMPRNDKKQMPSCKMLCWE